MKETFMLKTEFTHKSLHETSPDKLVLDTLDILVNLVQIIFLLSWVI